MRNALRLIVGSIVALFLGLAGAQAQSACQYIAYGAVLTPAEWNACFAQKADFAGGSSIVGTEPILINVIAGITTWSFDYTYSGTFTAPQAIHAGTLSPGTNAFGITATQPATPVASQVAVQLTIAGAGSASQVNQAMNVTYSAGYTGSSTTAALTVANSNLGTGGSLSSSGALTANEGGAYNSNGAGTGYNIGIVGRGINSTTNFGVAGIANSTVNSGTNIGVMGMGINTGTSPVEVGVWATLGQTTLPGVSAALIADTAGQNTVPIALFQVGQVTKVEIQASGGITSPPGVTGGDEGVGTINATGLYVGGTAVLTANQSITLSGDTTGTGTTAITTTTVKVHGVAYGASPSTNTVPVVTGSNTVTYEAVPNAALANAATTVNGQTCTLGSTCTVTTAASSITIGTTTITSGTNTRILYDNSAVIGELATIPMANGGANAALTASNGGIVYSTASALAILAGTVTAAQCLLSGSNAAPTWGSCSGAAAVSAVSNSDGTLTISPTTGSVVASIALGHANTWSASQTFSAALIYGGVTLANSVTGTGSMVLATAPTVSSLTVTTAFTATGLVTLGDLATQAANTVLVNATSGVASPTAQAVSSCSAAGDALIWTTNTGFGCNTSITAAAVPASGLTGTTLASGVVTSSLTTVGTIGTGVWQGTLVGATYGGTGVNNGSNTLTLSGGNFTVATNGGTLAFGAASKTLTINNSLAFSGTDSTTMTFPSTSSTVLTTGNTETMTVGLTFTSYNAGTASGTFTPTASNANYQFLTNNGAFTMAAPSTDSAMDILVTNGASAGTITFSGYTVGANTGDAYATTNGNKYIFSARRINGVSTYVWKALQ